MKKKIQNRRSDHISRTKLACSDKGLRFSPKKSQNRSKNFYVDNEGYFNWPSTERNKK